MISDIFRKCMKFKHIFLLVSVLLLFIYACELIIPYVFSDFIDVIIENHSMTGATESIYIIVGLTIVLMVGSYFHHILSQILIAKISYSFLVEVDKKLENLPLRKTEKYNSSYLNNRIINDILTSIGFVSNNFMVSFIMLLSTIIVFYLIIQISVFIVLVPLTAIIINVIGIVFLNKSFYKRGYKYRDDNNQYVSDNHDLISHIKETKIHSWYQISGDTVNQSFQKTLKTGIRLNRVLAILNNIGKFSKNLTLILTMIVGGLLFLRETITIGEFILITFYTNMCLTYSEYFLKLGQEYQHAKISHYRLYEFLSSDNEKNGTKILNDIQSIEIKNLEFCYSESKMLFSNFDYLFKKGKIYCIVGKNGEGKSTLIDLLLGLDYNFNGVIKYNNTDISSIDMISLRKNQIAVIMQEPRLQRLSIKDNITRGLQEYSTDYLEELCNKFNLKEIYEQLDSTSLSGGEKQKVSIVRGLLKKSALMILDEPVSALDSKGIEVLKSELFKRKSEGIIIIISHNESIYELVDEFINISVAN